MTMPFSGLALGLFEVVSAVRLFSRVLYEYSLILTVVASDASDAQLEPNLCFFVYDGC